MKNNRFEKNRFDNYNDNYTRGHAVAPKKQSRTPLALAIISLVLVSLLLASTVWLVCMQINRRDKAQPAAITATISQNNALPKSATPAAEKTAEVKQTAAQPAAKTAEVKQTATQPAVQKSGDSPAMAVAKKAYAGHNLAYTDAANIILVDGERVYMDTKRIAPEHTGTPLHIYANGKTSYGFDWRITTDKKTTSSPATTTSTVNSMILSSTAPKRACPTPLFSTTLPTTCRRRWLSLSTWTAA